MYSLRQYLLQEVVQQHLSRRKRHIYRYHGEIRPQITVPLLWHLPCESREDENINVWRTQKNVICLRHTTSAPDQTFNCCTSSTETEDIQTHLCLMLHATFMYPSVFCTCLKLVMDTHFYKPAGRHPFSKDCPFLPLQLSLTCIFPWNSQYLRDQTAVLLWSVCQLPKQCIGH